MARGPGGRMIKECMEVDYARPTVMDVNLAAKLWGASEKQIEALEKEGAVRRALIKKMEEEEAKKEKEKGSTGAEDNINGTDAPNSSEATSSETGAKKPGSRRSRKAG